MHPWDRELDYHMKEKETVTYDVYQQLAFNGRSAPLKMILPNLTLDGLNQARKVILERGYCVREATYNGMGYKYEWIDV